MYKVTDLNEESGFNDLQDYYNKHKHKQWNKWLEVNNIFPRPGKQGLVGTMKTKDDRVYVFKLSQYINYLVQHELTVMKSLNTMSSFCPHFCKGIGGVLANVNSKFRQKNNNPFDTSNTKYPIEKEVLLMEYLPNTTKLYNYIRSTKINDSIIYSAIKQTLLAISMAQQNSKFTHYDLHSNNIMMKKCDKDLVFLYILDENNQYCIPTHGHYPVVIDFGFAYAESMNDNPLWPSLGHTDIGFTSDRFDPIADPKLFLVTVASEMMDKRSSKTSRKFRNIVRNLFSKLEIDWGSGWDDKEDVPASDYILKRLERHNRKSELFRKYDHFCIDILQSLIILPLEKQNHDNIDKSYKAFLQEFIKIEKEIGNSFYSMYILKGIVDIAREIRSDYRSRDTREQAISYFQNAIYELIDSISNYCCPKNVHFEKMLCGLLCLSRNIEGVLYDVMNDKVRNKHKDYKKLPITSLEQMYAILETNIPDTYEFNENTVVMVMDTPNKTCGRLTLTPTDINQLNDLNSLCRGTTLYEILQHSKNHLSKSKSERNVQSIQ